MDEIRTSIRKGQKIKLIVMTLLCLVAVGYGAWQVWYRLPQREAEFEENRVASKEWNALYEKSSRGEELTDAEAEEFYAADNILKKYKDDPPQKPSKYDSIINLWLWFIGGLSGIPFLLWPFWKYRNGGWKLLSDGTLVTARGERIAQQEIKDIDMTSWRGLINPQASNKATWRAKLILADGRSLTLDDYPWDGMGKIIGYFGHHFHPDTWDAEGEPIKEGIERAAKKIENEATNDGEAPQNPDDEMSSSNDERPEEN